LVGCTSSVFLHENETSASMQITSVFSLLFIL
jgi:hypothetical protein